MDIPHMEPVIGINGTDVPETKMLMLLWGNPHCPYCQYIGTRTPPFGLPIILPAFPLLFTSAETFGISLEITPKGFLVSHITAESRATYPDGRLRPWRSKDGDRIRIRTHIAAIVRIVISKPQYSMV